MADNLFQSLSITSAFNSIVQFFRSQENTAKSRLTQGSEYSFLLRLLSNVFSTLSYRIVAQSRENYLETAVLPSSCVGISQNLGYSPFRGSNLKRFIQITPNGNYTLPRLSAIGTYSDLYNIYVLEETTLEEGVPTDVRVVVGNIKEETFTVGTSAIKNFTLFTAGISEDYTLYLDSTEVPTTKVMKQMTEDKYLVRTNPYKSVDIMYLNTFPNAKYKYGTGSEITIRYIELADVPETPFNDAMFTYGTLNNVSNISSFLPFESVEQMKINAPLDHETQNLIRSKQDYANRVNQIIPAVIDSNYEPLTPTYTLVTYLKNDFTLLNEFEKEDALKLLDDENYFGTPLPDITAPRREVANLKISIALNTKYKNIADINLDIDNILESFYDAKLGSTFSTYDLERKIETLSYVKYARVGHVVNSRQPDKNYQVGYVLNYGGQSYIATKILGLSGDMIPNWNIPLTPPADIDTGLETIDGSIVWRAYKRLPNMPTTSFFLRQSNMQYGIGDYVYDEINAPGYMFKCVDLIKSSGFISPDLTFAQKGQFVNDGNIVWVVKEKSDTYPLWSSATSYRMGASVNAESGEFSLECIGYTGTTGTDEELNFELPIYNIEEVRVEDRAFVVDGNKTYYFRPNDIISITYPEGSSTFAVVSSSYENGKTVITVSKSISSGVEYQQIFTIERGTRDGQVLWNILENADVITYPWNGYVVFEHELEIID